MNLIRWPLQSAQAVAGGFRQSSAHSLLQIQLAGARAELIHVRVNGDSTSFVRLDRLLEVTEHFPTVSPFEEVRPSRTRGSSASSTFLRMTERSSSQRLWRM